MQPVGLQQEIDVAALQAAILGVDLTQAAIRCAHFDLGYDIAAFQAARNPLRTMGQFDAYA